MSEDLPAPVLADNVPGDIAGGAGPRLVGTIDPVGPLNVFNEKIAAAEAVNRAIATKEVYDAAHPLAPATAWMPPNRTPIGEPVSAGRRIDFDATKFVIDSGPRDRVLRNRRF